MRSTDLVWRRQYLSPTGDVVLLQSGVPPIAKFVDPKMGWSNVVKGQILRYRLPGWHEHMFYSNDAVATIAEHLQPLLNQVNAETCTFEDRLVKRFA